MAVDRYERSARLLNVPNVTDVGSRQALQASQSLQQRLDNISKFALGKLQDKATQEGQMYGVKNTPTLEQITRAVQQDQDVNELFAEEGTVFGSAARKVQAQLFRQDSYATFSSQIDTIAKNVDNKGVITLPEVEKIANEIQANINGTVEILKDIDVTQAVKFNAEANVLGNTLFTTLNTKALELELNAKKEQVKQSELSYKDNFIMTLAAEKGDVVTTKIKMASARQNLEANYGILPDGLLKIEQIDALEKEAMKGAAGKILSSNPVYYENFNQTYNQLITNNPPAELAFIKELPRADRIKIASAAKKESKDLIEIQKASLNKTNLADKIEANRLANEYLETKDPAILEQIKVLSNKNPNAISYKDIKALVTNEETWKLDDEEKYKPSVIKFVEEINNGTFLKFDEMQRAAKENGFSDKLINQYLAQKLESKRIRLEDNAIESAVDKIVSPAANKRVKSKAQQQIDFEIEKIKEQNKLDGKNMSTQDIIEQATEKVKKDRTNKNLNTALETLTNTFQSYGLSDIQNEIPQDSQGRYIIDTNSPEIIAILKRIKDEKGDGAFNNIKSIFVNIQNQYNKMDEM